MHEDGKTSNEIGGENAQKLRWLIAILVLTLVFATGNSVSAQTHPCGDGIDTRRVTYFTQVTNSLDSRTDPGAATPLVKLQGSLHYKTPDPGKVLKNRPVLIFNHGHEPGRGEACEIVKFFTDKDWVVFVPLRRGHFLDLSDPKDGDGDDPEDLRSTGIHVDNIVDACS